MRLRTRPPLLTYLLTMPTCKQHTTVHRSLGTLLLADQLSTQNTKMSIK